MTEDALLGEIVAAALDVESRTWLVSAQKRQLAKAMRIWWSTAGKAHLGELLALYQSTSVPRDMPPQGLAGDVRG